LQTALKAGVIANGELAKALKSLPQRMLYLLVFIHPLGFLLFVKLSFF
jgi:hypothetical protein